MMKLLYMIHVISILVWAGGVFHVFLLSGFQKHCNCFSGIAETIKRSSNVSLVAMIATVVSGHVALYKAGGMDWMPDYIYFMILFGYIILFIHFMIHFFFCRRLIFHSNRKNMKSASDDLEMIQKLMVSSFVLGLLNIALYFMFPLFV